MFNQSYLQLIVLIMPYISSKRDFTCAAELTGLAFTVRVSSCSRLCRTVHCPGFSIYSLASEEASQFPVNWGHLFFVFLLLLSLSLFSGSPDANSKKFCALSRKLGWHVPRFNYPEKGYTGKNEFYMREPRHGQRHLTAEFLWYKSFCSFGICEYKNWL